MASFDETDWTTTDEGDEGDEDSSCSEYEDNDDDVEAIDNSKVLHAIKKIAKTKIKKLQKSSSLQNSQPGFEQLYGPNSDDEYKKYEGKNLMIVIINKAFEKSDPRVGCTSDANNLKKTFKKLGFIVKVFKDLTAQKMDIKLRKASQKFCHKDAGCFACVISSHGNNYETNNSESKDMVLGSDDALISVEYIMKLFDDINCPDLIGKPRLFFIQACRGRLADPGVDVSILVETSSRSLTYDNNGKTMVDAVGVASSCIVTPFPCYKDSMVMFASPPGYAAYTKQGGTIFISNVCDEFKNYSEDATFFHILTRVSYHLAFNYTTAMPARAEYHDKKVVPCIYSRLTKDVKFFATKKIGCI